MCERSNRNASSSPLFLSHQPHGKDSTQAFPLYAEWASMAGAALLKMTQKKTVRMNSLPWIQHNPLKTFPSFYLFFLIFHF